MDEVWVAGLRCRDQWYSNGFLRPSFQSRTSKDLDEQACSGMAADGLPRASACPLSRARHAASGEREREPGASLNPSLGLT
jgi:hypothetical protein